LYIKQHGQNNSPNVWLIHEKFFFGSSRKKVVNRRIVCIAYTRAHTCSNVRSNVKIDLSRNCVTCPQRQTDAPN